MNQNMAEAGPQNPKSGKIILCKVYFPIIAQVNKVSARELSATSQVSSYLQICRTQTAHCKIIHRASTSYLRRFEYILS